MSELSALLLNLIDVVASHPICLTLIVLISSYKVLTSSTSVSSSLVVVATSRSSYFLVVMLRYVLDVLLVGLLFLVLQRKVVWWFLIDSFLPLFSICTMACGIWLLVFEAHQRFFCAWLA